MALQLEEFVDSIENLPGELKHYFAEIRTRDDAAQELRKQLMAQQKSYITAKDDKEASQLAEKIQRDYKTSRDLTDEKIMLADKAMELLQRHIKKLDETLAEAIKNVDESALPTSLFEGITPSTDKRKKTLAEATPSLSSSARNRLSRKPPRSASYGTTDDEMEEMEDGGEGEPLYCICQQVSFGEMIACDNAEKCPYEWFHYECVGLSEPPQGTWYCPMCSPKFRKQ